MKKLERFGRDQVERESFVEKDLNFVISEKDKNEDATLEYIKSVDASETSRRINDLIEKIKNSEEGATDKTKNLSRHIIENAQSQKYISEREVGDLNFKIEIETQNNGQEKIIIRSKDGKETDLSKMFTVRGSFAKAKEGDPVNFGHKSSKLGPLFSNGEVIFSKMNNPSAFLVGILHEIGHANDLNTQLKHNFRLNIFRPIANLQRIFMGGGFKAGMPLWYLKKEYETIAKSERNAWAFSLKKMRELEKNGLDVFAGFENKTELKLYVDWCLATYERDRVKDIEKLGKKGNAYLEADFFKNIFVKKLNRRHYEEKQ